MWELKVLHLKYNLFTNKLGSNSLTASMTKYIAVKELNMLLLVYLGSH